MSINVFTIVGNLTRDIELRYTTKGTPVATYAVAVNNYWYDDAGRHDQTDFIPVTTYGNQAQSDAKYLKKGSPVAVAGRIRSWYKKETQKGGFKFEAFQVDYLGLKSHGNSTQSAEADNAGNCLPDDSEHAQWLRDYDSAASAGDRTQG